MTENNDTNDIHQHIDHQRWLLEHGFINDLHKDNLFMYGSIVHPDVEAVDMDIDIEKKLISYKVFVKSSLLTRIDKYKQLSQDTTVVGMWRFKRMLKKEGNLNLKHLLNQFVGDYCGPKWSVNLVLKDFKDYEEGFKAEEGAVVNKQPDSR